MGKKVLLAPLDPVHDLGLKLIRRALVEAGHEVVLLQPDLPVEEVVETSLKLQPDVLMVGRTLGYGVAELLARLVDLMDASGLRKKVRLAVGGRGIRPELGAELGFDGAFGPDAGVAEAVAFVEERAAARERRGVVRKKPDLLGEHNYRYELDRIAALLETIARKTLSWAETLTSPGIQRARARNEMLFAERELAAGRLLTERAHRSLEALRHHYVHHCGEEIARFYQAGELPGHARRLDRSELSALDGFASTLAESSRISAPPSLRNTGAGPAVLVQYGTGCPFMDTAHIKVAEAWGADGIIHFDPSWGARAEGLLEGLLTHEHDGSVVTRENLELIGRLRAPWTLWQVRAHRGLNTPETVVLAGWAGADLTKINMVYGSLGGGTDPARLVVDGLEAARWAAHFGMPFDVVTNEELAGVPPHKALAGMLAVAHLGLLLGGRPILQPLFCFSPYAMIEGFMDEDYIDFNAAKVIALRRIIDAPIWPGAPIGFLTHTEDRVQSSTTTALHAALGIALGVEAISIASSDEAYAGGPISAAARIDTLLAVRESFRFLGRREIAPGPAAFARADSLVSEIEGVLEQAAACEHLADALYRGIFGTRDDGVYPGRGGIGSLVTAQPGGLRPGAGMMDDSPASPNPGTGFPAGEGCRSREGSRS